MATAKAWIHHLLRHPLASLAMLLYLLVDVLLLAGGVPWGSSAGEAVAGWLYGRPTPPAPTLQRSFVVAFNPSGTMVIDNRGRTPDGARAEIKPGVERIVDVTVMGEWSREGFWAPMVESWHMRLVWNPRQVVPMQARSIVRIGVVDELARAGRDQRGRCGDAASR